MTKENLQRANALQKKISQYEDILESFYYKYEYEGAIKEHDRTPRIILDVDDMDDGREQIEVPMDLSSELRTLIEKEVRENLETCKKEFNEL